MQSHPYFLLGRVAIFAHRGSTPPSENTYGAFYNAIRLGADYIETDVRASKDGVAVLAHDSDLRRLAGQSRKVEDLSWQELSNIELTDGGKILSLEQALLSFPEVKFNIDIKASSAISDVVRAIEETQSHDRVLVSSFSNARRLQALALLTKPVATSASAAIVLKCFLKSIFGLSLDSDLNGIGALQIPFSMYGIPLASKRFISAVLKTKTQVHFWTINDKPQAQELIKLGATGLITDDVALIKELVQ